MKLKQVQFVVEDDNGSEEVVSADWSLYGDWQQWGAREAILWETMPMLEAMTKAINEDEDLYVFVHGEAEEDE